MHLLKNVSLLFSMLCFAPMLLGQQFVKNEGQWPEPFAYKLTLKDVSVFVSAQGMRINLRDPAAFSHFHDAEGRHELPHFPIKHHGLEVIFTEHKKAEIIPQEKIITYHNYYLGNDTARWKTQVPLYNSLDIPELYPGISMRLKPGNTNLKYDLIVAPEANPADIAFTYRGADSLHLSNGRLVIYTSIGRVVEEAPIAWQKIAGQIRAVPVAFNLQGNSVKFSLGAYSKTDTLIIDPNYIFSTYTGSTADNFGYTATYDNNGNTYGGGIVFSPGSYPTLGAFQDTFQGGMFDVSISKISPDGTTMLYSTYLGGSLSEQPHSMVVDHLDNLIVFGLTGSANFPVTSCAFDTSYNGGPNGSVGWAPFVQGTDIFITKFSANGAALLGSTFLGGTSIDGANNYLQVNYGDAARGEVIVDQTGNVFFVSSTGSIDFPVVGGTPYQDSLAGGQDAVLGKLSPDLCNLLWSTYLGGSENDAGYSLKLNSTENTLFTCGGTRSDNFPSSTNSWQTARAGTIDGWITSFNAQNGSFLASTFNGTPQIDQNFFIALDDEDDVYVFGQTKGNYPITPGLWGVTDGTQFIHKFTPNLQQSLRAISFGGGQPLGSRTVNISPTALMVDACKSVYLSGWGGLTNFEGSTNNLPYTKNALDTITDGSDFYFLVLDGSWQFLEYASFFGGANTREHVDGGTSRFSPDGIIYQAVCAGCGGTSGFPAFPSNVFSTTNNSNNCNMACLRIDFELRNAEVNLSISPDSVCAPYQLAFTDSSSNIDVMLWDFGDGTNYIGRKPNKTFNEAGVYPITIIGLDTLCSTSDTSTTVLHVFETLANAAFTASWDTCSMPFSVTLNNQSTNASSFTWNFGDGTTSTQANPAKTYANDGTYTIALAAKDDFCDTWDTAYTTVAFKRPTGPIDFEARYNPCTDGTTAEFIPLASGYQLYYWSFGDNDSSRLAVATHTYQNPGTYTITLVTVDTICNVTRSATQTLTVSNFAEIETILPNVFTPNNDGQNDYWQLSQELLPEQFTALHVEVYNRWGKLIYTTNDPGFLWEGSFEGNPLAEAVYFWLAEYTDVCGTSKAEKGVVHIMR